MRIAVTGSTGWIGQKVCDFFTGVGAEVIRVSRSKRPNVDVAWNVISNGRVIQKAIKGCDAVVHCAAHVHRPNETQRERELFNEINVEGTRRLVHAVSNAGVPRLIFLGTLAVYKWGYSSARIEEDSLDCQTAYAKSKREGELIVKSSGLDWRVLRLATVYGDGDFANFYRLARSIKRGRIVLPSGGKAQKSIIHLPDVAAMIVRMTLMAKPKHRLINVANPVPLSVAQISDGFSRVCGFGRVRSLPMVVMRPAALLGDLITIAKPNFPLSSSNLVKLSTSTVVDVHKMTSMFPDYTWQTFEESLMQCASHYQL